MEFSGWRLFPQCREIPRSLLKFRGWREIPCYVENKTEKTEALNYDRCSAATWSLKVPEVPF